MMQLMHPGAGGDGWWMGARRPGSTINQMFDLEMLISHRELHFSNVPNGDLNN